MRLFVAVNFEEKIKMQISRLIGELQKFSDRGNFTRIQNLHITLQFIGETDGVIQASEAVKAVDFNRFSITFDHISGFKRHGGEICWLGVSDSGKLTQLAENTGRELKTRGFGLEERPFVAHLTLGREVVFKKGFDPGSIKLPSDFSAEINKISLMKSERIKGILTYSEIMGKQARI